MPYRLNTTKSTHLRPHVPCAQCHENLFMPEWSEYVDENRVRHLWKCEACDYAFETQFTMRRRQQRSHGQSSNPAVAETERPPRGGLSEIRSGVLIWLLR